MDNVVSAAIEYAQKHQDGTPDTQWHVQFVGEEYRTGTLEHVKGNVFALVKSKGDTFYFDADKVVFLRIK